MKSNLINSVRKYLAIYYNATGSDHNFIKETCIDYNAHISNIYSLLHEENPKFTDILISIIDSKKISDSQVYHQANISRSTFNRYKNGTRIPDHHSILKLMIGMQCNLKQAEILMRSLGYSFSTASKTDLIIRYFIENEYYDIMDIDNTLVEFGESSLFSIS